MKEQSRKATFILWTPKRHQAIYALVDLMNVQLIQKTTLSAKTSQDSNSMIYWDSSFIQKEFMQRCEWEEGSTKPPEHPSCCLFTSMGEVNWKVQKHDISDLFILTWSWGWHLCGGFSLLCAGQSHGRQPRCNWCSRDAHALDRAADAASHVQYFSPCCRLRRHAGAFRSVRRKKLWWTVQPSCSPVGFPRQKTSRGALPLPASVQQAWTLLLASHPNTNHQDRSCFASNIRLAWATSL